MRATHGRECARTLHACEIVFHMCVCIISADVFFSANKHRTMVGNKDNTDSTKENVANFSSRPCDGKETRSLAFASAFALPPNFDHCSVGVRSRDGAIHNGGGLCVVCAQRDRTKGQ